jgi:dolichol-phosphate mannosyltransferase
MSTIVVIPTYNERENLPALINKLFTLPIADLELLVIDDNSPDGTGDLAESLSSQYPGKIHVMHRSGKLGLGTAYVSGFQHALDLGADRIVQMDADFSHPPEKLVEFIQVSPDFELVVGSRYIPGGSLDYDWPLWRKALSGFGNFYARTILGSKVHDMTGGYRMWRRDALEQIPFARIRSNGYMFQVEMAYLAALLGFKVKEIPIHFAERKFGKSKINFSIQLEAALSVWKLPSRYRDLVKKSRQRK